VCLHTAQILGIQRLRGAFVETRDSYLAVESLYEECRTRSRQCLSNRELLVRWRFSQVFFGLFLVVNSTESSCLPLILPIGVSVWFSLQQVGFDEDGDRWAGSAGACSHMQNL
jgi:hypothetical protein